MPIIVWNPPRMPSRASWRLVGNTQIQESPFDGTVQTVEMPGARWSGSWTWNSTSETEARAIAAFLAAMRGRAGRAALATVHAPGVLPTSGGGSADSWGLGDGTGAWLLGDGTGNWGGAAPLTVAAPVVDGGGQTGAYLDTKGWIANADTLRAGSFFSFMDGNGRYCLHMVLDGTYTADGVGRARFHISPPLRSPPNANTALEIVLPRGTFMLAQDDTGDIEYVTNRRATVTIEFIEALV